MIDFLPPGLVLVIGVFAVPFVPTRVRPVLLMGLPLLALALVWNLPDAHVVRASFIGYEIMPIKVDALSRLFATIFLIMTFAGALFAYKQSTVVELVSAGIYAGSAVGVAMAGDLITVFIFWEIMAIGSTVVIWSAGTVGARNAAMRYLMIHLLGGVVLMVGVIAHVTGTGSTAFTAMKPTNFATWMILIGFLVNAGAPPVSAWLADAYPEGSPGGTVFLSAFTTKTAVYVLLRGFPGSEILIFVGIYMIFYGIIYALLENDMRRILAYSICNQVGFMVTGIGIGTEMALNGAAAHAFTHIIYKGLLLMSAGSVLFMTGKRKCTDLGGLFQSMPLTALCGIIGALAISSFPFTSGFVSKSMIAQAAGDEHMLLVWLLLAAASAGVFLHAGIKFPWFVFFQKDSGMRPDDPPLNMRLAMIFFAFLCIAIGVFPEPLYALLPYPVKYEPYTAAHVVFMCQLLLFAGLAFFVMLPAMKRTLTISLDFDWFYRKFGVALAAHLVEGFSSARALLEGLARAQLNRLTELTSKHHGPSGVMARSTNAGTMVVWVLLVLALVLVLHYL
ncbi:MAG: Na(+)/H(+) antiporter subunit D [Proteobacteria bacterium]|nr:Na(+)/H(+) antiporter subunit D [Pseudomonadota bacterium]